MPNKLDLTSQQTYRLLHADPMLLQHLQAGGLIHLAPSAQTCLLGLPQQNKIRLLIAGNRLHFPLTQAGLACALDLARRTSLLKAHLQN